MQRRRNVFPFLLTTSMMTICKPWLEKSSEDSNKIYQLFERIPYESYFRKYLKIWYQWFQGRSQIVGFHFNKFGCCKPTTFPKVLHHGYFLEFGEFFQNWHKEQFFFFFLSRFLSTGTTEEGWRDRSCYGTAKEVNHYGNSTVEIFTIFWVSFILIVFRCTRVSSCGKVVGHKVEIPIPDLWILKEGEVLVYEGCRVN